MNRFFSRAIEKYVYLFFWEKSTSYRNYLFGRDDEKDVSAYSSGGDNSRTLQMTSNVANRLGFRSTGGVNNSSASGGGASMHQPVAMRNTTVRRAGGGVATSSPIGHGSASGLHLASHTSTNRTRPGGHQASSSSSAALSPNFNPALSPLATKSPSVSPLSVPMPKDIQKTTI